MKPWINEEIIQTWTNAQKRLWESLCAAVPFQPPAGVEAWRETYLKNLAIWESAVKQTLEQEAAWVEQWVRQVAHEKGSPEMVASWIQQMEEVLQRWIQTQNQWWNDYFAVLRHSGLVKQEQPAAQAPAVEAVAAAQAPAVEAVAAAQAPAVEAVAAAQAPAVEAPAVESPSNPRDDLKFITGIGPALEKKLNARGILTYRQLAMLNEQDIERIETAIKATGRIRRDDWVGQARARHLEKYQEQL